MTKSKKVFVGVAILFFIGLAIISYDISRRTTFPGSKSQLKERIKKQLVAPDSTVKDSIKATYR
ncbi:MAG TPA: hypothetical protein DIS90_14155 [Cytophagales bacterium]|nr:hypothetical protein [Cytophagales bacterium]